MDPVTRAVVVYVVLLLLFRLMGKRALSQATTVPAGRRGVDLSQPS